MNKRMANREQEPPKWGRPIDIFSQNIDMKRHLRTTRLLARMLEIVSDDFPVFNSIVYCSALHCNGNSITRYSVHGDTPLDPETGYWPGHSA